MKLATLLLAAGGATRMGSAKQLLPYRGKTLVYHAANTLITAGFDSLTVVVGNQADAVANALAGLSIQSCVNENWQSGIGSSVRAGVGSIMENVSNAEGILIALADQPLIPAEHFVALREAFSASSTLVASAYDGVAGVPALFGRAFFDQLLALSDRDGAKSILRSQPKSLVAVPLTRPHDIDSPADYEKLLRDS